MAINSCLFSATSVMVGIAAYLNSKENIAIVKSYLKQQYPTYFSF